MDEIKGLNRLLKKLNIVKCATADFYIYQKSWLLDNLDLETETLQKEKEFISDKANKEKMQKEIENVLIKNDGTGICNIAEVLVDKFYNPEIEKTNKLKTVEKIIEWTDKIDNEFSLESEYTKQCARQTAYDKIRKTIKGLDNEH